MSGRGGGGRGSGRGRRGRGYGQGQPQSPSAGGGGGGEGGRGRGGSSGRGRGSPGSGAPTPLTAVSTSSLSSEVERKLTVQSPASSSSSPAPSAWNRPSSSRQPQPAPAAEPVQSQSAPMAELVQSQSAPMAPEVQQQQQLVAPVMSSKQIRPPLRPDYGTIGRRIIVRANHFLVQIADRDLHHYDVTILPEVTSKKVCRDIIANLVHNYKDSHLGKRKLAYDGRKSAYTGGPLPFSSKDFVIKLVDNDGVRRERQFKVSIKFAAKADLHHLQQFLQRRQLDSPQETIQALDVALRVKPSSIYEVVGRSFFSPDLGNYGELGNGVEYWRGFYQSLRPTEMGLSLNVDISARAFYEPILVTDFVAKFFKSDLRRPLSDHDRSELKRVLKGVKIELTHQGYRRCCKISGLSAQPIHQLTFPDDTGVRKSVVQYFREKYHIMLRYTSLPALQAGSDANPVYLPMEISRIVEGQRYTRKLNAGQVRALLKAACQRPPAREKDIREMVRHNNYNNDDLVNEEFGIRVMPELTSVEARVLPPPVLKYHGNGRESLADPRVGQWNMTNKKMINGAKVEFWTCISFLQSRFDVGKFCKNLISTCCGRGMDFNPTPLLPITSANPAQVERVLSDIHVRTATKLKSVGQEGKQLQLLIVILPDITGFHGKIKKICETDLGIVSQCCQPTEELMGGKRYQQYLENLALKINVKAGGRNTVLEQAIQRNIPYLTDMPTIIFGADVTHPQPGEDSSPSIAAVVASMDWPEVTNYRALVSAQAHREEIIVDLYQKYQDPTRGIVHGGLIRELLMAFWRSTKLKPARILFYRDGVSEGQFNQVLLHEMEAIRQACNSLQEDYQPRVTFVVVQKRHHTRLFPEKHGDPNITDRSGNILPGTVVDTKICHPTDFDFYLCSHAGIQGTSRPTHYHVLYDENGFTANGLQMLTNYLCYTYVRCTRSVSIVPPAYYAHLAAFRARDYMEGELSDGGSTSGSKATRDKTDFRTLPPIKENVKDVMFYC